MMKNNMGMISYDVELTDAFAGEANYSWVKRATITTPELTRYGYSGSADGSYHKANKAHQREVMRRAKAVMGLTGVRGRREDWGDTIAFYPARSCTVMFITYRD